MKSVNSSHLKIRFWKKFTIPNDTTANPKMPKVNT